MFLGSREESPKLEMKKGKGKREKGKVKRKKYIPYNP